MELLGVGPLELLLIMLLGLILLGPKDMEKTAKTIGKGLNQLVRSDTWKTMTQATQKLRTLPQQLMREANLEELSSGLQQKTISQQLSRTVQEIQKPFEAWTTQPAPVTNAPENPPEPTKPLAAQEKSDEVTSQ